MYDRSILETRDHQRAMLAGKECLAFFKDR